MTTWELLRGEAELVIETLEDCDPRDGLMRWLLAAELREKLGLLPIQRQTWFEDGQEERIAQLRKACVKADIPVPDWQTPAEKRAAEIL